MRNSWEWYISSNIKERERISKHATSEAKEVLEIGDRVSRMICGGGRGTFTFTGWDGDWCCGSSVSDCHATSIIKVNGNEIDFIIAALI